MEKIVYSGEIEELESKLFERDNFSKFMKRYKGAEKLDLPDFIAREGIDIYHIKSSNVTIVYTEVIPDEDEYVKVRLLGSKEDVKKVLDIVLKEARKYKGLEEILK